MTEETTGGKCEALSMVPMKPIKRIFLSPGYMSWMNVCQVFGQGTNVLVNIFLGSFIIVYCTYHPCFCISLLAQNYQNKCLSKYFICEEETKTSWN